MVAELAALAVVVLSAAAEMRHAVRIRHVSALAFGPRRRPAAWVWLAPLVRIGALGALCWGMVTLMLLAPKVHRAKTIPEGEYEHVILVLDVSPSMRLVDAGPTRDQSRMQRAHDVMESFFQRVAIEQFRISVIATYNGAKPVVVDTTDVEVVRNILGDLPMHYAFKAGKTDIFAGLQEAANMARGWNPRSATVLLVSDGDTVSSTGMPKMPTAVRDVVVVGIGDPVKGSFIDGKNSRQDASTLRQVATRLGGVYHNGNEKHLSTELLKQLTRTDTDSVLERLTRREYALIACSLGAVLLAALPILLHYLGTGWKPGANRHPLAKRETAIGVGS